MSLVSPAEFLAPISHQLLHGVYFVGIPLNKCSVVFSEAENVHQLCVGLRCLPCQHCLNRFRVWSDSVLVYKATQILFLILQDLSLEGLTIQAGLLHASKDFVESLYVILQNWCRDHNVINVTHYEVPIILCYICELLGHQSLKCIRRVA